jgi:hypothetical protein
MAVTPTFSWMGVHIVSASDTPILQWGISGPSAGATPPSTTVAVPVGTVAHFGAGVAGSPLTVLTPYGITTQGSTVITSATGLTGLVAGQQISGLGVPANSYIESVGASSITFVNGEFNEDTGQWVAPQGATASIGGQQFYVTDLAPIGTLLASVTPSTGITLADQNADSTGNVSHIGNGTAICNLIGEGEGGFTITVGSAGTFTVECTFVTNDSNYSGVTVTPAIVLVAS